MPNGTDAHVGFLELQSKQTCRGQCLDSFLRLARTDLVGPVGLELLKQFLRLRLRGQTHGCDVAGCVLVCVLEKRGRWW